MNSENQRHTRLQKLSDSDFEIADGQPDIRGWKVKDGSGKQFGEVEELIFDYESCKVRYIVADLKGNDYSMEGREVLIPIGIAELHKDNDDVILSGVTMEQISSLPQYDEDRFDTTHETNVRNVFGGLGMGTLMPGTANADFYDHEHFNENNLLRNRRDELMTTGPDNTTKGNPGEAISKTGRWLRSKNVDQ